MSFISIFKQKTARTIFSAQKYSDFLINQYSSLLMGGEGV